MRSPADAEDSEPEDALLARLRAAAGKPPDAARKAVHELGPLLDADVSPRLDTDSPRF
jgi:hypothetical protein